jgi:hypothetical protein
LIKIAGYTVDQLANDFTMMGSMADSTGNADPEAHKHPQPIAGKLGGTRDFEDDMEYLVLGNATNFDFAGDFTVEAQVKFHSLAAGTSMIASKGEWIAGEGGDGSVPFYLQYNNGLSFGSYAPGADSSVGPIAYSTTESWSYIVGVRDGTTWRLYLDGTQIGSAVNANQYTNDEKVSIGALLQGIAAAPVVNIDAAIDEVRISGDAHSAAWVKATYHSENDSLLTYTIDESPFFPLQDHDCAFTVESLSSFSVNISAEATDFYNSNTITIVSGSPGINQARLTVFESGDGLILTTSPQAFLSTVTASSHRHWELRLETGSSLVASVYTATLTFETDPAGASETVTITFTVLGVHRRNVSVSGGGMIY